MDKKRLQRSWMTWLFIVLSASFVLLGQWYNEVNQFHDIEELNDFRWQKYMNEEEFARAEIGMSYMDVVEVAKGEGERVADEIYVWGDELLLTQSYALYFQHGILKKKKIIKDHANSTRTY